MRRERGEGAAQGASRDRSSPLSLSFLPALPAQNHPLVFLSPPGPGASSLWTPAATLSLSGKYSYYHYFFEGGSGFSSQPKENLEAQPEMRVPVHVTTEEMLSGPGAGPGVTWAQLESSHGLIPWELQGVNNCTVVPLETSRPGLWIQCQSVTACGQPSEDRLSSQALPGKSSSQG